MDDGVWNHAVFSKNRDRLLNSDVAQQFFAEVNKQAKRYMSDEHFTVDGTLIAAAMVTRADGYAERDAALLHQKQGGRWRRITVGAYKAYDTKDFVSTVRELNVTPHVTKNDKGRSSNLDRRTTRQPGYAISLSGDGWSKRDLDG